MSSFVTNVLVLVALITNPTNHLVSNIYFASMSIADLAVTILVMLPSAIMDLMDRWPLGFTLCQVHTSLDISMCTVSILHLVIISHDKYTAIVSHPLSYMVS